MALKNTETNKTENKIDKNKITDKERQEAIKKLEKSLEDCC
jgi:hypothetical protein